MSELYETDVVAWADRQSALLRRRAAGELVNEADLDWPNIAEEIESVGSEQVHSVESLLVQAMLHDLKCAAWPDARDADHWDGEARRFRADAARRFVPSMRRRLDVAKLYASALHAMPRRIDGQPPRPVPAECPFSLDELLKAS